MVVDVFSWQRKRKKTSPKSEAPEHHAHHRHYDVAALHGKQQRWQWEEGWGRPGRKKDMGCGSDGC